MASTVILGAGIIGCSTAYYLSESSTTSPHTIHLVESSPEMFASASGKAAGFLASDWFAPSVAPLGALSFQLHKELANKHGGRARWGYSFSTGASLAETNRKGTGGRGEDWLRQGNSRAEAAGQHEFRDGVGPAWLTRRKDQEIVIIGEDDTVAQVDPLRLSQYLLEECQGRGVQLHQPAQAVALLTDEKNLLSGVRIRAADGTEYKVPCTRLLISAGAWTQRVFATLFPSAKIRIPISQLAGHSIVVRSPRWTAEHEDKGCHAVFTTMRSGFSPEIMSRIGGEIYVAGLNSSTIPLPELATDTKIQQEDIDELKKVSKKLLGLTDDVEDLEVTREGLCFRPVTPRGQPIMCRIPDSGLGNIHTADGANGGVFIAAGHGPWGISLSLGTGQVMADMLEGKTTAANVRSLGM